MLGVVETRYVAHLATEATAALPSVEAAVYGATRHHQRPQLHAVLLACRVLT